MSDEDTPEVYVSECCGGLFVPGHGPDDIHEAVEGESITLRQEPRGHIKGARVTREVYVVSKYDAESDAIRAGECPACGSPTPTMEEISTSPLGIFSPGKSSLNILDEDQTISGP